MATAAGTVYRGESQERFAGAVLKAQPENGAVQFALTDDDGDFTLNNLALGRWRFVALGEGSVPSDPQEIDLQQDRLGMRFELRQFVSTQDSTFGKRLFASLIAGLIFLVIAYVAVHLAFQPGGTPLSSALVGLTDQAIEKVQAAAQPAGNAEAVASVVLLKGSLSSVLARKPEVVGAADGQVLTGIVERIELAVQENRQADALIGLAAFRRLLTNPTAGTPAFFWNGTPWRYLEVMLWGLAGVLVSLILTIANYLRRGRFYREGWVLHVAQLVVIPMLTLVVISLLSLASLTVTVANSQVQIDLQDPLLLVTVSFLVAFGPWEVVRFIRSTSGQILGNGRAA